MIVDELKKAILHHAFTGNLTNQSEKDTDVEKTLKIISDKKKQLIDDKKIPADNKFPIISESEKYIMLPKGWKYARVQEIANYITDYVANGSFATLKANTKVSKIKNYAVFVRTMDLSTGFTGSLSYIDEESYKFLEKSKLFGGELILPNIGGSIGKVFSMPDLGGPMSLAPNSILLKFDNMTINNYFKYFISSPFGKMLLLDTKGGTATPKFSKTELRKMVIPLPPIEEQQRIIDKIEELFSKLDEMKNTEEELNKIKNAFPGEIKQSILQCAIEGKLTNRLSSDTPIDRQFPKLNFYSNEGLFQIPNEWKWIKFKDLVDYNMGKTPPRKDPRYWGKDYSWISIADMVADGNISSTKEKVSYQAMNEVFKGRISKPGTLIMSFKLTVGKVSILDIEAVHNEAIISVYPKYDENNCIRNYLFKILPVIVKYGDTKGAIKGNTLNSKSIDNLLIPLPPLEEQQRIAEKLDNVLSLIESL